MRQSLSFLLLLLMASAQAADHRDAPIATADPAADINDIYAFMNPVNPDELILVNTVVPFADYNSRFSDAVDYVFHIDNGSAAGSNLRVSCSFTQQSNRVACTGPGGATASGGIERTVNGTGMRVWAGLRDDPFFFDGPAFQRTRTTLQPSFTNPGVNSFNGNTLALIVGIERGRLSNAGANPVLKVWGSTQRRGEFGVSPGFTGLWMEPNRPGHGIHVEILAPASPGGPDRAAVAWYVYDAISSQQRWIVGEGTVNGDRIEIPQALTSKGASLPPNFNPANVRLEPFGRLDLVFSGCSAGRMTYVTTNPDFAAVPSTTFDIVRLTQIKDQSCTFHRAGQVDRMGRPGVNTVLINVLPNTGTALKDAYNRASDPAGWAALFEAEMASNLAALDTLDGVSGNALLPASVLASVLVDDRLIIDTSQAQCDAYLAVELGVPQCGGRTLARDVIDDSLGAIVGPGVSDNVANDSVFLGDFPFLGRPL